MKTLNFLCVLLCMSVFISCNKEDNHQDPILQPETISAKWIVNGTSDYVSFEFNKSGSYIVVQKSAFKSSVEQDFIWGTYQIVKDTVILSDFGKIVISGVSTQALSFKLLKNSIPGNEFVITAFRQTEMKTSSKTEMLCRTWELVSENGKNVIDTDDELTVLFSKAGTYLVHYANPDGNGGENSGGLALWKWNDENENKFLFSWDDWVKTGEADILELTNDKLILKDSEYEYVLKPLQLYKSDILRKTSIPEQSGKNRVRGNLLKKH